MYLTNYGWNSNFEQHLQSINEDGLVPGRIISASRDIYQVMSAQGKLQAVLPGRFYYQNSKEDLYPVAGDWAALNILPNENRAVIRHILPRKSKISRRAAGSVTKEQVIAANVDTLFIVSGLDGDFNLRRIERFITMAWESGAKPVILLNKADLSDELVHRQLMVEEIAFDIPVMSLSALKYNGLEQLSSYISKGETVAFVGSSGVGKSTIINCLLHGEKQEVQEVRLSDSHGRHTTTQQELLLLEGGGIVIDTPGIRELQLWTDEESLDTTFSDIEELALNCRFRNCSHENEPHCAVRDALEKEELDPKRYSNYLKLKREANYLQSQVDDNVKRSRKDWQKTISKFQKQLKKGNKRR